MAVFLLSLDNVGFIKEHLREVLPDVKSGHLTEALASGVGYRTHAAMLAAIKEEPINHPPLGSIDDTRVTSRLVEFGYENINSISTSTAIRSAELPDPIWVAFPSRDRDATDLWFFECRHRNIPNLRVEIRRKYACLKWDCISIDSQNEKHLREESGSDLVKAMYENFQRVSRRTPGKAFFDGSSFVGSVDFLTPEAAYELADVFFGMLYRPMFATMKPE